LFVGSEEMIRGVWVVRTDGFVPLSRRFVTVERKHRKQVLAHATLSAEDAGAAGAVAAGELPDDIDLGSLVTAKFEEERERGDNPPTLRHALDVAPNAWPMVVCPAGGDHLVAVLPLVPPEQLAAFRELKRAHQDKEAGLAFHAAMAATLRSVSSVAVAVEVGTAVARILAEGEADAGRRKKASPRRPGSDQANPAYQRVWSWLLDAIVNGAVLDTGIQAIETMCKPSGQKPTKQPQPFFKPQLFKGGRQRLSFKVVESVTAQILPGGHGAPAASSFRLKGSVLCNAEIEGLPDITIPLASGGAKEDLLDVLVHECTRSYGSIHKQPDVLCFSPPLGWFQLASYVPKGAGWVEAYFPVAANFLVDGGGTWTLVVTFRSATRKEFEHCSVAVGSKVFDFLSSKSFPNQQVLRGTVPAPAEGGEGEGAGDLRAVLRFELTRTLTKARLDTQSCSIFPPCACPVEVTAGSKAVVTIFPNIKT